MQAHLPYTNIAYYKVRRQRQGQALAPSVLQSLFLRAKNRFTRHLGIRDIADVSRTQKCGCVSVPVRGFLNKLVREEPELSNWHPHFCGRKTSAKMRMHASGLGLLSSSSAYAPSVCFHDCWQELSCMLKGLQAFASSQGRVWKLSEAIHPVVTSLHISTV